MNFEYTLVYKAVIPSLFFSEYDMTLKYLEANLTNLAKDYVEQKDHTPFVVKRDDID